MFSFLSDNKNHTAPVCIDFHRHNAAMILFLLTLLLLAKCLKGCHQVAVIWHQCCCTKKQHCIPTCMYTMIEFFFTVNINNVTTGTHFISPIQVRLHVGNDRLPEIWWNLMLIYFQLVIEIFEPLIRKILLSRNIDKHRLTR